LFSYSLNSHVADPIVGHTTDYLAGSLFVFLTDWSVGILAGHISDFLVGPLVDSIIGHVTGYIDGISCHSTSRDI